MRSIIDPNDPLYPKVRKLFLKIWAKGTIESKNISIMGFCFLWLLTNIITTLFFLAWRILAIFLLIFTIDYIFPNVILCLFEDPIHSRWLVDKLLACEDYRISATPWVTFLSVILSLFLITYPQKKFLRKVGEIIFMIFNIILIGIPLKLIAIFVDSNTYFFETWIDKSYILGPLMTGMVGIFPSPYRHHNDILWETYISTKDNKNLDKLDEIVNALEEIYF